MALCKPWDQLDLAAFVTFDEVAPCEFRNRHGDPNLNGRAYGGQTIAHALMVAAITAPDERFASTLSVLFLTGSDPQRPVDFRVTTLQEGSRFSSRHVRGEQPGNGLVVDAYATFCVRADGPEHSIPPLDMPTPPEKLVSIERVPAHLVEQLGPLGPYARHIKPAFDFRVPDIDRQMSPETASATFRFWIKARAPLPPCKRTHAAVFAFLSDWWLNFSTVSAHVRAMTKVSYIASLNHNIWFHRDFAVDDWMLFESESPCASGGRGLSIARVRNRDGLMLATVTQESVISTMRTAD